MKITKSTMLMNEIVHNLMSDYKLGVIEGVIAKVLNVEPNTEFLDRYFKLNIVQIENIYTFKICIRMNEKDDNWIMSPTLQFSFHSSETDIDNVIIYKNQNELIEFLDHAIISFKESNERVIHSNISADESNNGVIIHSDISADEADKIIGGLEKGDYCILYPTDRNAYTLQIITQNSYNRFNMNSDDVEGYTKV